MVSTSIPFPPTLSYPSYLLLPSVTPTKWERRDTNIRCITPEC